MNKLLAWWLRWKLERQRLRDEYRVAQAARPCEEVATYATSLGGHFECGTHGGIFGHCR